MGVGQIGVREGQRSRGRVGQRAAWGARAGDGERNILLRAGNFRDVIGAGDRDGDRHRRGLVERLEIVVDDRVVGQRQRLALGKEIEGPVGDAIAPGRRAGILVGGILGYRDCDFHRLDVVQLQLIQLIVRHNLLLRILIAEGVEYHRGGRLVARIEIGELDLTGCRIGQLAGGKVDALGDGRIGGDDGRWNRNVAVGRSRTVGAGRIHDHRVDDDGNGRDERAIGQLERLKRVWNNRVGEMVERLGVRSVREFQREYVADELLHLGRQRRQRLAEDTVADIDLLTGLVDHCQRRERRFVEQDVGTRRAIRLDQNLEFRIRRALTGHGEVDLDEDRGAADTHGRNRRIHLHVAVLGGLAGDKRDGAGDEAQQRRIVRPVRVVDHFVEHHPRIRRQAEYGAIDKGNAERRIRSGLDHVAFFDVVAVVQDDRNAVTNRGCAADELGYVADDLVGAGSAVRLRILYLTGQRGDEIAGKVSAIGRRQRRALLAFEVIMKNKLAAVVGKNEIDAGSFEFSAEKHVRIGNDDRIRRNMSGVNRLGVEVAARMQTQSVAGNLGVKIAVEFAEVIHWGTVMVNKYIISKV